MAEMYRESSAMTLRQEAIARVREMQRRAQLAVEQQSSEPENVREPENSQPPNTNQRQAAAPREQPRYSQPSNILGQLFGQQRPDRQRKGTVPGGIADLLKRQGLSGGIGSLGDTVQSTVSSVSQPLAELLDSFGIDGEKLIILMVMWAVFNNNKENKTLLMALGYLLL